MSDQETISVSAATADVDRIAAAEALAARLGVVVCRDTGCAGLRLRALDDRLELAEASMKPGTGVSADLAGELHRLLRAPLTRRDPLRRACGAHRGVVVDATAGLGTDAVRLATIGGADSSVLAIERSLVVFALIEDGLRRARGDERWRMHIGDRFRITHGDAADALGTLQSRPDVVFIDPMHPPKRRSSVLPRKEMQVLRRVVGADDDAANLLVAARRAAARRVIVKRPDHAPPLAADVTMSYPGKLVRLDVWVREAG